MKKYFLPCLVVGTLLVATGCGNEEEKEQKKEPETKVLTCTNNSTVQKGVEADMTYKVTYKGEDVLKVESNEVVTVDDSVLSKDKKFLDKYKKEVEKIYDPYKDLEHYNYEVKIEDKKLISTTDINYEKMDIDKFIEINDQVKTMFTDGKIKIDTMKTVYEATGAECK